MYINILGSFEKSTSYNVSIAHYCLRFNKNNSYLLYDDRAILFIFLFLVACTDDQRLHTIRKLLHNIFLQQITINKTGIEVK